MLEYAHYLSLYIITDKQMKQILMGLSKRQHARQIIKRGFQTDATELDNNAEIKLRESNFQIDMNAALHESEPITNIQDRTAGTISFRKEAILSV